MPDVALIQFCQSASGNAPYSYVINSGKWGMTMWSACLDEMRKHDILFDVYKSSLRGQRGLKKEARGHSSSFGTLLDR